MPQTVERIEVLLELIKKKNWKALETAWVESMSDPVTDGRFYAAMGQHLVRVKQAKRLEEMIQLVALELNDEGRHQEAVRILRVILRCAPQIDSLHEQLMRAIRGAYSDRSRLEEYIAASGLNTAENLGESLRTFELMMTSAIGSVFRHKSWGIGVVTEQDIDRRSVIIDFPDRQGQTFNFEGIRDFLDRLPANHIQALAARDADGLRARAHEDPVAVVKQALESVGGSLKQNDLKSILVPTIFTPAQWSRWWTSAKDKLRLDSWIDIGIGAHGLIALRSEPRSAAEDVLERFQVAETPHARQQAVREAVRFLRSGALTPTDLAPVSEFLRAGHETAEDPTDALAWAFLAEELAGALEDGETLWHPDTGALVREMGAGADLIRGLTLSDHQQRALELCHEARPERFGDLCVALIDELNLSLIKWVMNRLLEGEGLHQAAEDALSHLLHDPNANPDAHLWALAQVLGGPWAHLSTADDASIILVRTLDFLEGLQVRIDHEDPERLALRGLAQRIRNALEANRHELVVHTLRELPIDEARVVHQRIMGMTAFSDAWKIAVTHSIQLVQSDIVMSTSSDEEPLFVTAGRLREKQAELQHIRTVEIPKSSHDIEVAREQGDLSENAEYKAAKEHQVILHRRAEELQSLLDRAVAINPDSIRGDSAVPGTRVSLRRADTGADETFTLLGIWDANPEQHIISYQSPLGSQLLRRRVGEKFEATLPSGEKIDYEVKGIEKAV